jgi:hypothetical protein
MMRDEAIARSLVKFSIPGWTASGCSLGTIVTRGLDERYMDWCIVGDATVAW